MSDNREKKVVGLDNRIDFIDTQHAHTHNQDDGCVCVFVLCLRVSG